MRAFLAILALVGLLLSPVAASAAAPSCLHRDGGAMVMTMDAAHVSANGKASHDGCCDENGAPAKPASGKACAQACATVCGVNVALPQAEFGAPLPAGSPVLEPAPAKAFLAHAPPGLKRPPRSIA